LMALYNIGLSMGNAVSAAVCVGSSTYMSNLSWQIPIILQIPLGLILGVGVMMFPESPRWLLLKGKERKARIAFGKFYNKDPDSVEITRHVQEVQYYIELEKANGQTTSWTEIYHANDIRRTIASAVILVGLAITGSKFVVPYAALFLQGVGITNPYLVNFYVALCVFGGTFLGPWIVEYGGRRFAMLYGYAGMASCMLVFAAVNSGLSAASSVSKNVLVAMLCIWAFIFGGFIGTSVWIAAPEMHSVRLRTYGQAA
jgi:MFS transporter, SP family, sugar:H+ symporter